MNHIRPVIVLLAGGAAARMGGGDKGMRLVSGEAMLERILARLAGQGSRIVLNANGNPARFADLGLPVIADPIEGRIGPLAGVLAGLRWAAALPEPPDDIVTVPTDSPFIPLDLIDRLLAARAAAGTPLAVAASGGRIHPVVALWPLAEADALEQAVREERLRKVELWLKRRGAAEADFPAEPIDPFFNVNDAADLVAAEKLVGAIPTGSPARTRPEN